MHSENSYSRAGKHNRVLSDQLESWIGNQSGFTVSSRESSASIQEGRTGIFELKDADGELLGRLEVTKALDKEAIPDNVGVSGKRLLGCKLIGSVDGEEVVVDLLKFMERQVPGLRVFLTRSLESNYYSHRENLVVLNGLSTPLHVFTLLHEFGHAQQEVDSEYAALNRYYAALAVAKRLLNNQEWTLMISWLETTTREILSAISVQGVGEQALIIIDNLKQAKITNDTASGLASLQELERLLDAPRKVLERDANARALRLLRALRRLGIDLLRPLMEDGIYSYGRQVGCDSPITSVLQRMQRNLSKYQARSDQLRGLYGTMPRRRLAS